MTNKSVIFSVNKISVCLSVCLVLHGTDGKKYFYEDMCDEVEELMSENEEADGRMLLYTAHAVKDGYSSIIITSEDTYVYVLCLAFSDTIGAPLFQKCRTQTHTRLIDIRRICSALAHSCLKH